MAQAREFTDQAGRRWSVDYTDGASTGMIQMDRLVFKALDGENAGEERFLTVHPGYLDSAGDHMLEVALSQAQTIDPPW